jgi:hypothetical protein
MKVRKMRRGKRKEDSNAKDEGRRRRGIARHF